MKSSLLGNLFLLLSFTVATYSQQSYQSWNPELVALQHYKSNFVMVADQNEAAKMNQLWHQLGESPQVKLYAGTFGEIGYESGYFLRISPDKGFILIPYFDQNMVADYSYGTVTETPAGEVIFHPTRQLKGIGFGLKRSPLVWIPAINGQYIVPTEKIRSFGNYCGGFGIYNGYPRKILCDGCGSFAERVDRNVISQDDRVVAPKKYLKFIKQPIEGSILSIGRKYKATRSDLVGISVTASVTKVKINVGATSGVKPLMMFFLIGAGDNDGQILRVTRVYRKTSEAEIIRQIDKAGNEAFDGSYSTDLDDYLKIPYPPVRVGIKITTSPVLANRKPEKNQ